MGDVPSGCCLRRNRSGDSGYHRSCLAEDGRQGPIKLNAKTVGAAVVGVLGALLLGVGMCLSMVFGKMVLGIAIGLVGIVVLLMLIPLTKGVH